MDNIVLKKIWKDSEFYQVELRFYTKSITAKIQTYIVPNEIEKLSNCICNYINNYTSNFYWEIGNNGSDIEPKIIIKSLSKNKNGYVRIGVYCNGLDEDGFNYNYEFALKTELGLLQNFGNNVVLLNRAGVGFTIEINNTNILQYRES